MTERGNPNPPADLPEPQGAEAPSTLVELQAQVDTALGLIQASEINKAHFLLQLLDQAAAEERAGLLSYMADTWRASESSNEIHLDAVISEDELNEMVETYGSIVDGMLELYLSERKDPPEFYASLLLIIDNPMFHSLTLRAFVLYWLLVDRRLPYFKFDGGLRLSNEEWKALANQLAVSRRHVAFILNSDFDQQSERADYLLRELEDADDRQLKIRLLAYIVWESNQIGRRDERRRLALSMQSP